MADPSLLPTGFATMPAFYNQPGPTAAAATVREQAAAASLPFILAPHDCAFACSVDGYHPPLCLVHPRFRYAIASPHQIAGAALGHHAATHEEFIAMRWEVANNHPGMEIHLNEQGWSPKTAFHISHNPFTAFWTCQICDQAHPERAVPIPLQSLQAHYQSNNHLYQTSLYLSGRDVDLVHHPVRIAPPTNELSRAFCLAELTVQQRRIMCLNHTLIPTITIHGQNDGRRAMFLTCKATVLGEPSSTERRRTARSQYANSLIRGIDTVATRLLNVCHRSDRQELEELAIGDRLFDVIHELTAIFTIPGISRTGTTTTSTAAPAVTPSATITMLQNLDTAPSVICRLPSCPRVCTFADAQGRIHPFCTRTHAAVHWANHGSYDDPPSPTTTETDDDIYRQPTDVGTPSPVLRNRQQMRTAESRAALPDPDTPTSQ